MRRDKIDTSLLPVVRARPGTVRGVAGLAPRAHPERMTRSLRARVGAGLLILAILLPAALAAPVGAAAADFPAGWTGYHTYAEMSADVLAVATAHPDIVRRVSIGTSYQGRTIWAVTSLVSEPLLVMTPMRPGR